MTTGTAWDALIVGIIAEEQSGSARKFLREHQRLLQCRAECRDCVFEQISTLVRLHHDHIAPLSRKDDNYTKIILSNTIRELV